MSEIQVGGMRLLLDLSQPLYEQIVDQVRSSIAKGDIALGEKIPSVREMAQALKINPNTVMRAYQELDRDGLTETRRGQGTFITTNADKVRGIRYALARQAVDDMLEKLERLGFTHADLEQMIREKGAGKS